MRIRSWSSDVCSSDLIEREAQQVVAQRAGDELVDLVADLAGHPANDVARAQTVIDGAVNPVECRGVEEAVDQADVIGREGRTEPGYILGQHRMAKAIDDVREFGEIGRAHV